MHQIASPNSATSSLTASTGGAGGGNYNYNVNNNPPTLRAQQQAVATPTTAVVSPTTFTTNFVFQRVAPAPSGAGGLLDKLSGVTDLSATFWKPDASKGECGLLQALIKRHAAYSGGGADTDFLPLAMRPDIELANNFSNYDNQRVDLSGDRFKLSRATQTLSQLSRASGDGHVSVADVRDGLRAGIPQLQTDEVFLVKYRDYSDFATTRWSDEARRDRVMAPLFVERFFAIRVGTAHGVFIPVSEAQFVRGHEILSTANMAPDSVARGHVAISLTVDQFKSLGKPSDEFNPAPRSSAAAGNSSTSGDDDLDLPPAPSAFDWSAHACGIRWKRFTRRHFHSIGRVTLKLALIGGTLVFVKVYFFPGRTIFGFFGSSSQQQHLRQHRNGGGGRGRTGAELARDVISLPFTLLGALAGGAGSRGVAQHYDDD